jgi:hypothetical protein
VCGREALGGATGSDGTVGPAGDGSSEPWRRRPALRPLELAAASGRRQLTADDDGRRCTRIRARGGEGRAALDWSGRVCLAAARRWTTAAALKRWRRRANELGEWASRGRGWAGLRTRPQGLKRMAWTSGHSACARGGRGAGAWPCRAY